MADKEKEGTDSYPEETRQLYPLAQEPPQGQPVTTSPTSAQNVDQKYVDLPAGHSEWSTGLTDCMFDAKLCLMSFLCPLCYGMCLSQDLNESVITPCCLPDWPIALRQKIRMQFGIPGTLLGDCAMTYCCGPCALSQMGREVKVRQAHGQMEPGKQGMLRV